MMSLLLKNVLPTHVIARSQPPSLLMTTYIGLGRTNRFSWCTLKLKMCSKRLCDLGQTLVESLFRHRVGTSAYFVAQPDVGELQVMCTGTVCMEGHRLRIP